MKTAYQALQKSGDVCHVAKKGKNFLTVRNDELALTAKAAQAIAFNSEADLKRFVSYAIIDDRNARVIGNSYKTTTLTRN